MEINSQLLTMLPDEQGPPGPGIVAPLTFRPLS